MKNNKGITLVALVVTIIVLIILAGISINLVLGDNGIITIAKKAKENTELAKIQEETELNELYTQLEFNGTGSSGTTYDSIAKLTEFKTAIANAIDEAGGIKPDSSAETAIFTNNIKGIVKEVTKDATGTKSDIAEGKTVYVNGEKITGTMQKSNKYIIFATNEVIGAGNSVPILYDNKNTSYTIEESGTYNCCFITTSTYSGMGACTQLYVNNQKNIYANHGDTIPFSYYSGTIELNKGDVINCTAGSETHKNEYNVTSVCMFWKQ